MLEKVPIQFFKRSRKNGKPVYYARFLLQNGKYTSGKSTGKCSKREATIVAMNYITTGLAVRKNIKVEEFSRNFFDWNGDWALSKRSSGKRLSEDQCKKNNSIVENQINRLIGKRLLSEIETPTIRFIRNTLYQEGYAGSTINKILGVFKSICEYAEEKHLIRGMPRFERAGLNQKEKGILSADEVQKLFSISWPDKISYVANVIAVSTGFRLGEILGIKIKNIYPEKIEITGSWNSKGRNYKKGTKNGQASRSVPIPLNVQCLITELLASNPFGNDPELFLLYTENSPDRPIDDHRAVRGFLQALNEIGISEDERKKRNISFHSHRHFFNSLLIESKIPLHKIQRLTGHLSDSMTQRYYHLDDLDDVEKIQNDFFNNFKIG